MGIGARVFSYQAPSHISLSGSWGQKPNHNLGENLRPSIWIKLVFRGASRRTFPFWCRRVWTAGGFHIHTCISANTSSHLACICDLVNSSLPKNGKMKEATDKWGRIELKCKIQGDERKWERQLRQNRWNSAFDLEFIRNPLFHSCIEQRQSHGH